MHFRMMKRVVTLGLTLGLATTSVAWAEDLYRINIVYQVQPDSTRDVWRDIDVGDMTLRAGMTGSAFVGDVGVNLVLATAGSRQYLVDLTVTSLPPSARVVSKQFVLDRGRPIEVAGLTYELRYRSRLGITVHPYTGQLDCDFGSSDGARTVDEFVSDIPFHGAPSMINDTLVALGDEVWYVDPSAHFELYYIPNSLGDFAWNLARDFLEKEHQRFANAFHLSRAQRVNYFIAPCKVPEIYWIPNRNWAFEPTTFKAYALFNRDQRDLSGVPTNLDHFYRYLGYAPLCLAEGAARGFEYDHYYAKKLRWQGNLPRPSEWWPNIKYKSYPDSGLYIAAGSFVSYLIATRGTSDFYRLYGVANDLNADSAFFAVYGLEMRKLEDEWIGYIDTVRVYPHVAQYFMSRAKMLGRNRESIELLNVLIDVDTTDIAPWLDDVSLLYFLEGDYDRVTEVIRTMPERYRTAGRVRQLGNSALFFAGRVDTARAALAEHLQEDRLEPNLKSAICLMYGWLELTEGHPQKADSLFELPDPNARGVLIDQIEIALHRGAMLRSEGRHDEADSLYRRALDGSLALLQSRPGAGDAYLRIGEAYIGLGAADTAMPYLDVAEFLEDRPYYVGRVLVAIGNAYDLLGVRDKARSFYKQALEVKASYPARVAARRYLRTPYKVDRAS